jgi:hypothetical protein
VDRAAPGAFGLACATRFGRAQEVSAAGGVCRVEKLSSGRFSCPPTSPL